MEEIIADSSNLCDILGWHGWSLYDITASQERIEPLSWDEIGARGRANHCQFLHRYLLLPIPEGNEKLRTAYAKTRDANIFPILQITDKKQQFDMAASEGYHNQGMLYYFLNELYFGKNQVSAFSSPCLQYNYPSLVYIPLKKTVEVFSHYFAIAQFTSEGVTIKKLLKKFVN